MAVSLIAERKKLSACLMLPFGGLFDFTTGVTDNIKYYFLEINSEDKRKKWVENRIKQNSENAIRKPSRVLNTVTGPVR
jgi:hypothetical protein